MLLATVVGFLLVGACAATEVGVIAFFGDEGAEAGIVLAIWAVGSLVGGLFARPRADRAVGARAPACSSCSSARRWPILRPGTSGRSRSPSFVAGLGIAPALAVMFSIVSATVKFSDTAEAYGWVGTGQLIGAALGSARPAS